MSLMSSSLEDHWILISILASNLLGCVVLFEYTQKYTQKVVAVYTKNPASHRYKKAALALAFSDNHGNSFLILLSSSTSSGSRWLIPIWNWKQNNEIFIFCYVITHWSHLVLWMDYLPMHDILLFIVHSEQDGSLSYVDLLNVDTFHYTI